MEKPETLRPEFERTFLAHTCSWIVSISSSVRLRQCPYFLVCKRKQAGQRCLWPRTGEDFDSILGNTSLSPGGEREAVLARGDGLFCCCSDTISAPLPAKLSGLLCAAQHGFCRGEIWPCVSPHPLIFILVCCYKDTS